MHYCKPITDFSGVHVKPIADTPNVQVDVKVMDSASHTVYPKPMYLVPYDILHHIRPSMFNLIQTDGATL